MQFELLDKLRQISPEEQLILDGNTTVQKELYTGQKSFVIDRNRMLQNGRLIDIRPHTRFVHFPRHTHNYVEIIYMCSGTTTHIINGTDTVTLSAGEILFLSRDAQQEILPAKENDIAVNFMVLPEFFDSAFPMMDEHSVLRDFLIGTLQEKHSDTDYLHFRVSEILPIQNLMENMIYSLLNKQTYSHTIDRTTVCLLLLLLQHHGDKINQSPNINSEDNLIFSSLKYIEDNYRTATLEELSSQVNLPPYYLSKLIKKRTGQTFKQLLQTKRLNRAAFLLKTTPIPVENIITLIGYDNTSYFHRIFKEHFNLTPKSYRQKVSE